MILASLILSPESNSKNSSCLNNNSIKVVDSKMMIVLNLVKMVPKKVLGFGIVPRKFM